MLESKKQIYLIQIPHRWIFSLKCYYGPIYIKNIHKILEIKPSSEGLTIREKSYMEGDPRNIPKWLKFGTQFLSQTIIMNKLSI